MPTVCLSFTQPKPLGRHNQLKPLGFLDQPKMIGCPIHRSSIAMGGNVYRLHCLPLPSSLPLSLSLLLFLLLLLSLPLSLFLLLR